MAKRRVLIAASPGETRVALTDGGRLIDLRIDRPSGRGPCGKIYLGRVEKVLPGINAAFVDLGLERSGFLALAEARPRRGGGAEARPRRGGGTKDKITDYANEGMAVLVQVLRDPVGDKGAKLTARISLPGRRLVYAPGQDEIKASRRIGDEDEAGDIRDLSRLRAQWKSILEMRDASRPPACLHDGEKPVHAAVMDFCGADAVEILVDDPSVIKGLALPDLAGLVRAYGGDEPLFEAFGIEEQIEEALSPIVPLPGGGSLTVEETAALTAMDVDTGAAGARGGAGETALDTNIEAAIEAARQIRLRNLCGRLVIDFVGMKNRDDRAKVLKTLRRAVAPDPVEVHVAGFTPFGLVELTRRRIRAPLAHLMTRPCPACAGAGRGVSPETLAVRALSAVLREATARPEAVLCIRAGREVRECLAGPMAPARRRVERKTGRPLRVEEMGPGGGFEIAECKGG